MSSTHATIGSTPRSETPDTLARYLPIPFALLAVVGLGLWFSGGGEDNDPTTGGLVGAAVICLAMLCLIGFASWLAGSARPMVRAGAVVLAVAGLLHLTENLLVLGLGRTADGDADVWQVTNVLSYAAFATIGVGALLTSAGLAGPGWLRSWGAMTGVAGLVSGLSFAIPALDFLPGPFNVSLLLWLIVLGVRRIR